MATEEEADVYVVYDATDISKDKYYYNYIIFIQEIFDHFFRSINRGPQLFDEICEGSTYNFTYQYGDACVVWYVLENGNIILYNGGDVASVVVYTRNN